MYIKEIREKLCLTQREFAELLGVSMQTISNWECGYNIGIRHKREILKICKNNGIKLDY